MGLRLRAKAQSRFVRHRLVEPTVVQSKENLATLRDLAESEKLTR
jgi:hypothetical protein